MEKIIISVVTAFLIAVTGSAYAQNKGQVKSILEIFDIQTGRRTIVKEFGNTIEAPNWSPDGKWLLYNQGGRLYKIAPESGAEPTLIDMKFVTHCNNDHVISTDGKYIGMSANAMKSHGYSSYIYIAPFEGGEAPRLITPLSTSYLHGWSPDMKTLVYCAMRESDPNGDIYIIPAEGGDEIRLTTAEGLDDGPEYSPDGKHIWFNSVRTGDMQLWRMNADGTEQTQMTFDTDLYSWFPHVSPDGKKVVYLCFHKGDLAPNQHLANKHVLLRIMPTEGGSPQTLLELFGGQGTINVNSWAPDSHRFAFVSYKI